MKEEIKLSDKSLNSNFSLLRSLEIRILSILREIKTRKLRDSKYLNYGPERSSIFNGISYIISYYIVL